MEDDQQFCLRWNNHQSTLIQNFDTLLESGTLVDCTLAAEGKYLKAHKVVLSACSPYFEGLLSEHYDKHPVFILKDVKFKELKAMMDYMYRGEVNISQDQLTALLKAAESLQIKGLSDNRTGGTGTSTGKAESTRSAKTASSTVAGAASSVASVDIPHASSSLTIEKNSSKVPRQSLQQVPVSDLTEDSASPQLRGLSSREGSQSPTGRKRKRARRRSLGNDDNNTMDNHEASNSSDAAASAPALGVAPVGEERSHAESADPIGRSALMQQLTKPADEILQIPVEKPEPSEEMIQPKSEFLDDQDNVEDLTNLDDDMNDLDEMEDSRAGPSHDPSQHHGMATWHMAGDRSNPGVVGAAAGPTGAQDEVFLAAHEAAQAQRDSQVSQRRGLADQSSGGNAPCDNATGTQKAYLCDKCGKSFADELPLRRHKVRGCIDTPFRFKCFYCSQEFKIRDGLTKHMKKVHPDKDHLFTVDLITGLPKKLVDGRRKEKSDDALLKKRVVRNITGGPRLEATTDWSCEKCGKCYQDAHRLKMHETEECIVVPARFKCRYCPYRSKRLLAAEEHTKKHHPGEEMEIIDALESVKSTEMRILGEAEIKRSLPCTMTPVKSSIPKTVTAWPCLTCGGTYDDEYALKKHKIRGCIDVPAHFKCFYCPYRSKQKASARKHVQNRHPGKEVKVIDDLDQSTETDVPGDEQSKAYRSFLFLSRSRAIPKTGTGWPCQKCGKSYKDKYLLKRHGLRGCIDVPQRFKCGYCPYRSKQLVCAKVHSKKYHPGKELKIIEDLRSDDTIEETPVPGKAESKRSLPCTMIPSKSTISKIKTRWTCRKCGRLYDDEYSLKQHKVLGCADIPKYFECPHCSYRARQQIAVKMHMQKYHPDEDATIFENSNKNIEIRVLGEVESGTSDLPNESEVSNDPGLGIATSGLCDQSQHTDVDVGAIELEMNSLEEPKRPGHVIPDGPGYTCANCGKAFQEKHDLGDHLKYGCITVPLRYQCLYCPFRSESRLNIPSHIESLHPGELICIIDLGENQEPSDSVPTATDSV